MAYFPINFAGQYAKMIYEKKTAYPDWMPCN